MNENTKKEKRFYTPEFVLVCVMLCTLLALVLAVLFVPMVLPAAEVDPDAKFADILEYRKSILAVIITAFGAWVGAGAAYFFGRENLREASQSLLAMKEKSPREQLRNTSIKEIALPLIWTVKEGDVLEKIVKKLKDEPGYWFISILKENGILKDVISEEVIWRFIEHKFSEGQSEDSGVEDDSDTGEKIDIVNKRKEIADYKVSDVLEYINSDSNLAIFKGIYITVVQDTLVSTAHDAMNNRGVRLAIVRNDDGKPISFITMTDIRNVIL